VVQPTSPFAAEFQRPPDTDPRGPDLPILTYPKIGPIHVYIQAWRRLLVPLRLRRRHIQETTKTSSKTLAKAAEQRRRRELEEGFNSLADDRKARIRTIAELPADYLEEYKLRHRSTKFAEYAVRHVTRIVGGLMTIEANERTVLSYQTARLKELASPKTINEEVGFLLRLLQDQGDSIRARLKRRKQLKLAVGEQVGRAFSADEKNRLIEQARARRSNAIYPALMLAMNCGLRDKEIRSLQWGRVYLDEAYLVVGQTKTVGGTGRTIPLNSTVLAAVKEYSEWYGEKFGELNLEWFVFPFGNPQPTDPTKPCTSFKTVWSKIRADAGVKGRWHDNRHTLITELAESRAGEQTIQDIAGHVSRQMLKHYSHIRMDAKRKALDSIVIREA
jgi:integrase